MVRGRLRTRRTVVNDPGRSVPRAVRVDGQGWSVLVVRGLPEPAEAAAGSDSPCTVCDGLRAGGRGRRMSPARRERSWPATIGRC
jgi:hypothetical protein